MSKTFIVVLDADACVKMGKLAEGGTSHLSEVLSLCDHVYIHETVFHEIKNDPIVNHLEELIQQNLLELISDNDLLDWIDSEQQDEETTCVTYVQLLIETLDFLENNRTLPSKLKPLANKRFLTKKALLSELVSREEEITHEKIKDLGEVKAIQLALICNLVKDANVNLFLSDDKRAKKMMVNRTNGEIGTCSAISSFLMLKEAGFTYEECEKYFKNYNVNEMVRTYKLDRNKLKETSIVIEQVFKDIFDENKQIFLHIDGKLRYQ